MIRESDSNVYLRTAAGAAAPETLIKWKTPDGTVKTYANLAQFRADAATRPYEARSVARDGAQVFVNVESGDYRLAPGSPALGQAAPLPPAIAALARELGRTSPVPFIGAFPARD